MRKPRIYIIEPSPQTIDGSPDHQTPALFQELDYFVEELFKGDHALRAEHPADADALTAILPFSRLLCEAPTPEEGRRRCREAIEALPAYQDQHLRHRLFFIGGHPVFSGAEIPDVTCFQPVVSFPDDPPRFHPIPWLMECVPETTTPTHDICLCGDPSSGLYRDVEAVIAKCGRILRAETTRLADDIARAPRTVCVWENGHPQDAGFYSAVAQGRIPVLITDTRRLPFEECLDYSSMTRRLGITAAELALLPDLLTAPITAEQPPQTIRSLRGQHFSRAGLAAYIVNTLEAEREKAPRTAVRNAMHEFPLTDSAGHLLDEPRLFAGIWRHLARQYPAGGNRALLFMAAGKFLRRFLEAGGPWKTQTNIRGVADDSARSESLFAGYPLRAPAAFSPNEFAAVFLATDSCGPLLAARCRETYSDSVTLLQPSVLAKTSPVDVASADASEKPHLPNGRGTFMHRLEGVVVCVRYGDYLSWSLPGNRSLFDRLVVVTAPDDTLSQSIAGRYGATVVTSERFSDGGAVFNKGRMLNDGLKALRLDDWLLVFDSDILLPKTLRTHLQNRLLRPDSLYYSIRLNAPETDTENWLTAFESDPGMRASLSFDRPGANRMPWGYFQLFHAPHCPPGAAGEPLYSEQFPNAGDVDYEFQARWPAERKILLPEAVIHLPHGSEGANWSGRTSRRLQPRPL